jgi:hypothetical protein
MDYRSAHSALVDAEVLFKLYKNLLQMDTKSNRITTTSTTTSSPTNPTTLTEPATTHSVPKDTEETKTGGEPMDVSLV